MSARSSLLFAIATFCWACGSEDPGATSTEDAGRTDPLLPWKVGNSWTYDVTAGGVTSRKVTTLEEEELVGGNGPYSGRKAIRAVTAKGDNLMDETRSWQAVDGQRLVRYREQAFSASTQMLALEEHWDPPKLRVDSTPEHTKKGAQWLEIYDETKAPADGTPPTTSEERDLWTVLTDSEEVTVPAGTFDAIVLSKVGGTTKTYWYVRGVGKVKETGSQTEVLVEYEVAD